MVKKKQLNNGITLIALVITIIVLLILAAISIAMLTGENGLLSRAVSAREESSHAEVKEKILLEKAEYELEKNTPEGSLSETLVHYLGQHGYLKGYVEGEISKEGYILEKDKLDVSSLGKGIDKTTGDVYVIEPDSDNWVLKYYGTNQNSKDLLNFSLDTDKYYTKKVKFFVNDKEYECIEGYTFIDWFRTYPDFTDDWGYGPKDYVEYYNEYGGDSSEIYYFGFLADEENRCVREPVRFVLEIRQLH